MNIRPVDLQVLIPRSTEVSKAQQVSDQQPIVQQQQFAEQLQERAVHRQQQVQSAPKNEGGIIQRDQAGQKREDNNRWRQANSKAASQKKETSGCLPHANAADPVRGQLIDVKT